MFTMKWVCITSEPVLTMLPSRDASGNYGGSPEPSKSQEHSLQIHYITSPLQAYTHFETQVMHITPTCAPATTKLLQTQEVRQIFIPVSVKRAARPDGNTGRVLRDCVHQLW